MERRQNHGHLFDSLPITLAEWWDGLLWPTGCPYVPVPEAVKHGGRAVEKSGVLSPKC